MEAAVPAAATAVVTPGAPVANKSKFKWEHGAMIALGGAALITGGMLLMQWKHATMGRKISKDLVAFLKMHGAQVDGDQISGGPITVPMSVDEAVIGTVDTIIRDVNGRTGPKRPQQKGGAKVPDVVAAAEAAAAAQAQAQAQAQGQAHPGNGRAPARGSQMITPQVAVQGGNPVFPESPISGKTGLPVSQPGEQTMMQLPQTIGGMTHDSRGEAPGDGDDYSYRPPVPPGMSMPPGGV